LLISIPNAPIASLVLASGKTRFLVYSSAVSCTLSLPITAILASRYNVGAAVIGYLVYVSLQIGFYNFYYTPKVLKLNSFKIFSTSFLPVALVGVGSFMATYYLIGIFIFSSVYVQLLIQSAVFCILFLLGFFSFVYRKEDLQMIKKIINKRQ